VRNVDEGAEVGYIRDGKLVRIAADASILACYNVMIPYMVRNIPQRQLEALRANVKGPPVYVNVALRNWHAWHKLGVAMVFKPGGM